MIRPGTPNVRYEDSKTSVAPPQAFTDPTQKKIDFIETIALNQVDRQEVATTFIRNDDGHLMIEPTVSKPPEWTWHYSATDKSSNFFFSSLFEPDQLVDTWVHAPLGGTVVNQAGEAIPLDAKGTYRLRNGELLTARSDDGQTRSVVQILEQDQRAFQAIPQSLVDQLSKLLPYQRINAAKRVRELMKPAEVELPHPLINELLNSWDGRFMGSAFYNANGDEDAPAQQLSQFRTTFESEQELSDGDPRPYVVGRGAEPDFAIRLAPGQSDKSVRGVSRKNLRVVTSESALRVSLLRSMDPTSGQFVDAQASSIHKPISPRETEFVPLTSGKYTTARPGDILRIGAVSTMVFLDPETGLCQIQIIPHEHADRIISSDMTSKQRLDYLNQMQQYSPQQVIREAQQVVPQPVARTEIPETLHNQDLRDLIQETQIIIPALFEGFDITKHKLIGILSNKPKLLSQFEGDKRPRFANLMTGNADYYATHRGINFSLQNRDGSLLIRRTPNSMPNERNMQIIPSEVMDPDNLNGRQIITQPVEGQDDLKAVAFEGDIFVTADNAHYIVDSHARAPYLTLIPTKLIKATIALDKEERVAFALHLQTRYDKLEDKTSVTASRQIW